MLAILSGNTGRYKSVFSWHCTGLKQGRVGTFGKIVELLTVTAQGREAGNSISDGVVQQRLLASFSGMYESPTLLPSGGFHDLRLREAPSHKCIGVVRRVAEVNFMLNLAVEVGTCEKDEITGQYDFSANTWPEGGAL